MKALFIFLLALVACENEGPSWAQKICDARREVAPMEKGLLTKITEQYNIEQKGVWPKWAASCAEHREVFEQAEYYTMYPAAFIAGFAMHESAGCKMSAKDWAGGRGWMQITHISPSRHINPIATMLGIEPSEVDYRSDPLHNVLVGVMVLDDYERSFMSRPHGIQAYNMGPGGVRKAMAKLGWRRGKSLPTILDMKPHLRYDKRMKPRVYVQKIAAAVIMMDKVLNGEPIERKEKGTFSKSDIPGWDPADDGDRFCG
ncbi:MAG: transglycosylase SLT domain-containing protein [bacterium]